MKIRKENKGIFIKLADSEFEKVFPGYREKQKWETLTEEKMWELYIPQKDDAECSLCVITGNQASDSWVLDYGNGREDIIAALTDAWILGKEYFLFLQYFFPLMHKWKKIIKTIEIE